MVITLPDPTGGVVKSTPKMGWIIGGAVALGVGVYVWWKHKQSETASTPTTTAGYGYAAYGYHAGYGYGTTPIYGGYGAGGLGLGYPGQYGSPYGYHPGPPTSNAQWATAVETSLGTQGYNAMAVSAALGKYLTGGQLTADQVGIVQAAIAFNGDPPVPGSNGYPPAIHSSGSGGGGNATNPVTGLKVTNPGTTGVDISWTASTGATSYQVTSSKGTVQMLGGTSARIRSINPAGKPTSAQVSVLAEPAGTGATPGTITVTTHK
jgi:hypothetical protein